MVATVIQPDAGMVRCCSIHCRRAEVPASPGYIINLQAEGRARMPFVEEKQFKYPAEDECLVRRLGAGVVMAWPHLPEDARQKILAEARIAWDREHFVSKLPQKLESILRRRSS